ncbi:MAG: hypothetical protein AWT59_2329 [Candidatus Gallionella acididurans]|uniref:Uncharacterized protein n=1 Tax=Candidatus Gallionella acididurans TaxID=1796491 RepID=A0A139BRF2_9PROT|nr:MAG: hypothetical protein AWT59_2329 [Candidatus Gallionella acididurans]
MNQSSVYKIFGCAPGWVANNERRQPTPSMQHLPEHGEHSDILGIEWFSFSVMYKFPLSAGLGMVVRSACTARQTLSPSLLYNFSPGRQVYEDQFGYFQARRHSNIHFAVGSFAIGGDSAAHAGGWHRGSGTRHGYRPMRTRIKDGQLHR